MNNMFNFFILFSMIIFFYLMKINNLMITGSMLLLFTLMTIMKLNYIMKSKIFSIIVFLSMISGLLIMFSYFISTSINSSTYTNSNLNNSIIIYMFISILLMWLMKMIITNKSLSFMNMNDLNMPILKFYLTYKFSSLSLIIFMLIILFYMTKICSFNKFSLRISNFYKN